MCLLDMKRPEISLPPRILAIRSSIVDLRFSKHMTSPLLPLIYILLSHIQTHLGQLFCNIPANGSPISRTTHPTDKILPLLRENATSRPNILHIRICNALETYFSAPEMQLCSSAANRQPPCVARCVLWFRHFLQKKNKKKT